MLMLKRLSFRFLSRHLILVPLVWWAQCQSVSISPSYMVCERATHKELSNVFTGFCGIDDTLRVQLDLKSVVQNKFTNVEVASCLLQSLELTNKTSYDASSFTLTIRYTIKEGDKNIEANNVQIQCRLQDANDPKPSNQKVVEEVTSRLPNMGVLATPPVIQRIYIDASFVSNLKPGASQPLGIGAQLPAIIQVNEGSYRNVHGTCKIYGHVLAVLDSKLLYTVKEGDPFAQAGKLAYHDCLIIDQAGNVARPSIASTPPTSAVSTPSLSQGSSLVENSPAVDGTLPRIKVGGGDVVVLVSTDRPARIGSVITLTFQAEAEGRNDYHGSCTINSREDIAVHSSSKAGLYSASYRVVQGDPDQNEKLDYSCRFVNPALNEFHVKGAASLDFEIDAHQPIIESTSILFTSKNPAQTDTVIEVQLTTQPAEKTLQVAGDCLVNGVSVDQSFKQATLHSYLLTYVVGPGEALWKAGELSIHCVLRDPAGNTVLVDHFTDDNQLSGRELTAKEYDPKSVYAYFPDKILVVGYGIVAIASFNIAKLFPYVGLPKITGYFFTGILAGPYVLQLISREATQSLRFIDDMALAYIGITAGSKLYWKQMRPLFRSILLITFSLTVVEYIVGVLTILIFASNLEFFASTTKTESYVIAFLAGCMMIARSPSTALAIIQDEKADGHFTSIVFAVTVVCDFVVIILFNINSMIAEALLSQQSVQGKTLLEFFIQLALSVFLGISLGKLLHAFLAFNAMRVMNLKRKSRSYQVLTYIKRALFLLYGFTIFMVSHFARSFYEPLFTCLIVGVTIRNSHISKKEIIIKDTIEEEGSDRPINASGETSSTSGSNDSSATKEVERAVSKEINYKEMERFLGKMSTFVYVSFFTLTGATLELKMLVKAVFISILLCITRVFAIFVGAYIGGTIAQEPRKHNCISWMAYITQAGVALGLAKKVQMLFPGWGSYFATFIVAVVICNQIIGPPLFRYAIRLAGDVPLRTKGQVHGLKALIFGQEGKANATLKERFEICGWITNRIDLVASTEDSTTSASGERGLLESQKLDALIEEGMKQNEPLDVILLCVNDDALAQNVVETIAEVCTKTKRRSILRLVVSVVSSEDTFFKSFSTSLTNRQYDAIDLIIIEQPTANEMLLELAAKGGVELTVHHRRSSSEAQEDESDEELTISL